MISLGNHYYKHQNIPKDWECTRLKNILTISDKLSLNPAAEKILSLTNKGIVERDITSNKGQLAESYDKYIFIKQGQICMNPMDLWSGWVDISTQDGLISPAYYTFVLNERFDSRFINYFLQLNYINGYFFTLGRGVASHDNFGRWVLTSETLKDIQIYFPNINEQKLISRYIDKKTEQIDQLVETIQKKIELLKEKRASLINQFATKGLESDIEMKHSGIEWIGEIPKHWDIKKLKYISRVSFSTVDRKEHDEEKKVSICHYTDVYKNEYIESSNNLPIGTCSENEFKNFSLLDGDILLTKDSESPEDIGIPTLVIGNIDNTVCGYHLAVIRMRSPEFIPAFIYRYIESRCVKDYFHTASNGITRFGLGKYALENILIALPPKNEQIEISNKIASINTKISKILQKMNTKIELLHKYRQSLISSAVIGKIRVTEDML